MHTRWSGLCALLVGSALAAQEQAVEGFHVTELAPGVWAAEVAPRPPFYAFANSLVVELEDGVLVVDTQQSPSAARALLGGIRARTAKPVRWVVATHHHADHVFGNQVYREAFPDVEFLGHATTAEDVRVQASAYRAQELEAIPARIEERAGWLEAGAGPDGTPLTDAQRASLEYSVAVNRGYLADLRTLEVLPPTRTFTDSLVVGGPGRRVHLYHFGAAHTRGDVVAWLPAERIVAVGDLLEERLPWLADSHPVGWAAALGRIEALGPATVVAAHGSVDAGASLLPRQADFFRALVEGVRRLRAEGVAEADVAARLDLERFREPMAGSGDAAAERFDEMVGVGVAQAWKELEARGGGGR